MLGAKIVFLMTVHFAIILLMFLDIVQNYESVSEMVLGQSPPGHLPPGQSPF